MPEDEEQVLPGGNVAGAVVRVGATVRKPAGPQTPAVEALLAHLTAAGFSGAPATLGRDDSGRHMLEFVPGPMAMEMPPLPIADLHRVSALIRDFHDAAATFEPPADAQWWVPIQPDRRDLICHHDLAPWNLVLGEDRWVFIDWDGAGPGSRLWDLADSMTGFVPLDAGGDPAADAPRIAALADGYRLTAAQREELPALMVTHTRGMFDLLRDGAATGQQPWARLYAEGHGQYWGPAAEYIERHLPVWTRVLSR